MEEKNLIRWLAARMSTRSIVVLVLLVGATTLAVIDPNFRSSYADLAKIGLGGYLGQLIPSKETK